MYKCTPRYILLYKIMNEYVTNKKKKSLKEYFNEI